MAALLVLRDSSGALAPCVEMHIGQARQAQPPAIVSIKIRCNFDTRSKIADEETTALARHGDAPRFSVPACARSLNGFRAGKFAIRRDKSAMIAAVSATEIGG